MAFCYDCCDCADKMYSMRMRIIELEIEVVRLRELSDNYDKFLNESLQHSNAMMGNMLNTLMTPGVLERIEENKTFTPRVDTEADS